MLNMALRWRFLFASGFLAFRRSLGKHRNIPSGETAWQGRLAPGATRCNGWEQPGRRASLGRQQCREESMGRKIAIVGAGAVGGYAGAHMVQAGEDVTFIDPWPEHVEHMRKHGPS